MRRQGFPIDIAVENGVPGSDGGCNGFGWVTVPGSGFSPGSAGFGDRYAFGILVLDCRRGVPDVLPAREPHGSDDPHARSVDLHRGAEVAAHGILDPIDPLDRLLAGLGYGLE